MQDTIRTLVAVADEIDPSVIDAALADPAITILDTSDSLNEDWQ